MQSFPARPHKAWPYRFAPPPQVSDFVKWHQCKAAEGSSITLLSVDDLRNGRDTLRCFVHTINLNLRLTTPTASTVATLIAKCDNMSSSLRETTQLG